MRIGIIKSKIIPIILTLQSSCNYNWNEDINLGRDFYFLVDPDFNSINVPVNPKKPYVSSSFVILNIEQIGFNKEIILAISDSSDVKIYWLIDKNMESEKIGYINNIRLVLSNVNQIDSIRFKKIIQQTGIEMISNTYYQRKMGYQ